ncbi:MAG: GTPase Der [Chlamydiales bacterium]|nr:GTPase Der [Chlamydiales bacterium]MCH9619654.1 GTPase Der [Chlamydiales bacterium]MCH9623260.1 GTPase Der [Chlamydiales bacterium]
MKKLAIVGRPNVGKSALFNRIAKKRIAIVDEAEGITRDRLYAEAELFGKPFEVIDTGGIDFYSEGEFNEEIRAQAEIALEEADTVVMVVDGRLGPTDLDYDLAKLLLKIKKPLTLAVNKVDDECHLDFLHAFYSLGIKKMLNISAVHGFQITELLEEAWEGIDMTGAPEASGIKVAIIGRANMGKSTLLNTFLNEKRSLVSPIPGTTRDSIDVPITYGENEFLLIDTAGIRKKQVEKEVVEKFAAIRTERAIERSDICLLLIDAEEGLSTQEKHIASQIEKAGKGCIILLNKWDLVKGFRMEHCLQQLKDESPFIRYAPILAISALTGRNVDKIFDEVKRVYNNLHQRVGTHKLNTFMEKAIQLNHPPFITGKRLRIYYLTQVTTAPPRFALFVNHPKLLTENYKRYLLNQFRDEFDFAGAPLTFHLKRSGTRSQAFA